MGFWCSHCEHREDQTAIYTLPGFLEDPFIVGLLRVEEQQETIVSGMLLCGVPQDKSLKPWKEKSSIKQDNNLPTEDKEMDTVKEDDVPFEKLSSKDVMKTNNICIPKVVRRGRKRKAEKQAEAAETAVVAAAVAVTPKVSPKRGRPAATEVKVPKPRGRPKLVKPPCPSETDIVHEEEKTKKKGLEEKPPKQGKKDEESQKEEDKSRKEFDRREAKRETEPKRRNTSQVGSASASDSEEDEGEHEGDKKKKGGRNFQGAHRRNMLQGQHERELTERKCKQEEQMESEP
ncbi:lens epithelium-derived growth factor-like [Calonectris borealis]|uniref:lens epithelium-derived growth factor-like n=1 Tax=Calonectris borealis TaxID=1323832 RepID=UPI003F4B15D8